MSVTVSPLGIFADMQLPTLVNRALEGMGRVDFVAGDAASALESRIIRDAAQNPNAILLIDAQVPRNRECSLDRQEKTVQVLLQDLRKDGINVPAVVITSISSATSELAEYCNPGNHAILLPLQHLKPQLLEGFINMLLGRSVMAPPTWDVIEVEVTHQLAKCFIGGRAGKMIEWGQTSTTNRLAKRLSFEYTKPEFKQGWARRIHSDGALLFNELVISSLGRGFFDYLELAAGGLQKLAFRFRIDDAALYCAPFEAAVREAPGQPLSGNENDYNEHPFVVVNAPIARRMKSITMRSGSAPVSVPHPARLLFIRSQVGENPEFRTGSDTLAVEEIDQIAGRTRIKHVEFRTLENIDLELQDLQDLQSRNPALFSIEVLDLSQRLGQDGAEAVLMEKLGEPFDVVHFAGHSFTTKGALTLLVLPSDRPGEAEGMDVQTFADGVAKAGARLVYLSSCQGSSANTVASLGQRGIPHIVGFRWDVEDDRAADFARIFYRDLFASASGTISGAFRAACRGVYQPKSVEASPIWASPILASRSDDWVAQRVLELR